MDWFNGIWHSSEFRLQDCIVDDLDASSLCDRTSIGAGKPDWNLIVTGISGWGKNACCDLQGCVCLCLQKSSTVYTSYYLSNVRGNLGVMKHGMS